VADIPNPLGPGSVRVAALAIGLGGAEILVAASRRSDFPTDTQRLLLGVAASQAAVAMRRWRAEADQRRFAALVDRSADFIGFATLGGLPQYLNPAGLNLVGLRRMEQARRVSILDFVVPEERERVRAELWPRVMRDGRWVGEIAFRHFDTGDPIPVLLDWFRIDDPVTGRPTNFATVTRDLTEQKHAEGKLRRLNETLEQRVTDRTAQLEEANRKLRTEIADRERADLRLQELQAELFHATRLSAMGQMAASLAHELNQPLTAATNFVRTAQRLLRTPNRSLAIIDEVMSDAAEQVLRAGQIVGRLRDFIAGGATEKGIESIPRMIEDACRLALAGTAGVGLEPGFDLDPDAGHAFADRIQVQQVLVNLIRNAAEALVGCRSRALLISTARLDAETVEIAVADTGHGVAPEVRSRLFEPFVSTKRNGMGLGLSICRSIIEAHGGWLRCRPNPSGGTIFSFTLRTPREGDLNGH
jgi:PAS domain S-box-containing protein